jgi:photosystem II stability/assembly factor-like uncharacterized protein
MHRKSSLRLVVALCLLGGAGGGGAAEKNDAVAALATDATDPFANLSSRAVGPSIGGRVARVTGVPGDPLTFYAATAAGGVWKSVNGGLEWKPIFDDQKVFSIGSIAVASSDSSIVYVGSGEANIRGNVAAGDGIYRSADAGKTWTHVWKQEGQIGTLAVHPHDPNIAFAAVLGRAFGPNPERGVYRTLDGGKTWKQVLAKNADTGASDVAFDPSNPRKLFAGFWQARRYPWDLTSGGPGSGLYVSTDLGETWKQLEGGGLPKGIWGKVGVRVAPSDSNRVYALIEAEKGGLFRSDDGGETWRLQNPTRALRQRAWYYTCLTVDPKNAEIVWFPQVPMLRTIDGGSTVQEARGGGWDYHDVWIDPREPRRMAVASDAGVSLSVDGGVTWNRPPLPLAQLYHVTVDNRRPYWLYAAAQDYGTVVGPSRALDDSGIRLGAWYGAGGGEAGHIAADPSDPNIVYAGEYLGYISRYDHQSRQVRNVSIYPENLSGHGVADGRVRFQWTAPILISPHDSKTVYHAGNIVFRTRDGGATWQPISPDLTRNDKTKQQWAGGPITGDNTGVEFYGTVFALAESPRQAGLLWAGSDDGLVHLSRDGGAHWENLTNRLPGLPEWATVRTIEASPHAAGTAFLVADAHRLGDRRPLLWRTDDYGKSWRPLTAGLDPQTYLHVVREDPERKDLLYLGAEGGVRISWDGGGSWRSPKLGLPPAAVHSLVVAQGDLVIGTLGRAIWILDDLTPLRTWRADLTGEFHLFPARAAVRWRHGSTSSDEAEGANPPQGATLHYQLDEDLGETEELVIEILDAAGRSVRRLSSVPPPPHFPVGDPERSPWAEDPKGLPKTKGLHRVVWDLREEAAKLIPAARIDWGDPTVGPLALPGTYTVRLSAGAGRQATTTLIVEQDPNVRGVSEGDLRAQHALATEIRDTMSRLSADVARLRSARDQLRARAAQLDNERALDGSGAGAIGALAADAEKLADELDALERRFHNPTAEVTYDILAMRGGAQLYSRLSPLYGFAAEGDGAPTQGVREVFAEQKLELEALERELAALLGARLDGINQRAREAGVEFVRVP